MASHQRLIVAVTVVMSTAGCGNPGILPPPPPEREEVIAVGTPTVFLTCAPSVVARPDTQNIGLGGGRLRTAGHELTIPGGAVTTQRQFILREQAGERVGVEVEQRADVKRLGRSATLAIDATRCNRDSLEVRQWFIWRLNPTGGPSQKLSTTRAGSVFTTQIDSTSGFIIAH